MSARVAADITVRLYCQTQRHGIRSHLEIAILLLVPLRKQAKKKRNPEPKARQKEREETERERGVHRADTSRPLTVDDSGTFLNVTPLPDIAAESFGFGFALRSSRSRASAFAPALRRLLPLLPRLERDFNSLEPQKRKTENLEGYTEELPGNTIMIFSFFFWRARRGTIQTRRVCLHYRTEEKEVLWYKRGR